MRLPCQIWDAAGTSSLLEELFDGTVKHISITRNVWKELFDFLAPHHSWYVSKGMDWSNSNWIGLIKRVEQVEIPVPPLIFSLKTP
jgi:hypothetical protein